MTFLVVNFDFTENLFYTVDDRFSDDLFSDNYGFSDQILDERISIYLVNSTSDLVIVCQTTDFITK